VKLHLLRWLRAPGSLSRRLSSHGRFEVQTLAEGPAALLPGEASALGIGGARCWVREVVLRVDGVAMVWARSVAPCRALNGPWQALRSLGMRPLAQLLFDDRAVRRSPLRAERHGHGGRWHRRACAAWQAAGAGPWPTKALWGRSSTFVRRGVALRVFEAFSPAVARLRPRPSRH
jgi:chorismate--pyruvate lyase